MKSNRAVGNAFEQELCDILFSYGFWCHNLKQDNSGQPADVIAARRRVPYLIDCKDCASDRFDLRRVEPNQVTAMELWDDCGNGEGWFAIKINGGINMLSYRVLKGYLLHVNSLPFEEIVDIAVPLEKWVERCR